MSNKGLIVDVFRNASMGDTTNKGQSSRFKEFTLTSYLGQPVNGPFEPAADRPEMVVVEGPYNSLRAIPKDLYESKAWAMFGGNFIYTCDSRFPSEQPIKIFDRVETPAQARGLSI